MLDQEKVMALIGDIKKKKELQSIDDNFVREYLIKHLQQEPKLLNSLRENFNPKSKAYVSVIKTVRSRLRRVYGLFRDNPSKRKKLVQELLMASGAGTAQRADIIKQILSTHSSTDERLPFYDRLYAEIFAITGKPKTLLDLGCGINPFSFSYTKLQKCVYFAQDINEEEIGSINQYFQLLHKENSSFSGKAVVADIAAAVFPAADVCLLFKMTDVIDKGKGHKKTEELLKRIPAKYIVVSFPTKTMSGKEMTAPRRSWMEWLCRRLGYEYTVLEFPNELFYVVKKR